MQLYQNKLYLCNDLQLLEINNSLKKYKQTPSYKRFNTTNKVWGYTIQRIQGNSKEVVFKFVKPNEKGKTKHPNFRSTGNVCIENNRAVV